MMQIFVIANPAQKTTNYVCDSQATIDAGQAAGYVGTFSVGTEQDANGILVSNQQAWLIDQAGVFCVNEKVSTDDGIQWVTVDLNTEPDNTDRVYALLNVPNGDWVQETGLEAAKAMFATIQQNDLAYCNLTTVESWTSWPVIPAPPRGK